MVSVAFLGTAFLALFAASISPAEDRFEVTTFTMVGLVGGLLVMRWLVSRKGRKP
jgi:hypothetical protein